LVPGSTDRLVVCARVSFPTRRSSDLSHRPRPLGHHRRMGRPLLPSRSLLLRNHPRLPLRPQTRTHRPARSSHSIARAPCSSTPSPAPGPCRRPASFRAPSVTASPPCRHRRNVPPRGDDALEQCYCHDTYFVLTNTATALPPDRKSVV